MSRHRVNAALLLALPEGESRRVDVRGSAYSAFRLFVFRPFSFLREQGMKDMDVLCRASAFLVPVQTKANYRYHLLTVSHAAAPWRWPKLYPEPWLRFVDERHCIFTAEARLSDGKMLTQLELSDHVYLHPTRDLAVVHLESEEEVMPLLKQLAVDDWHLLPDQHYPLTPEQVRRSTRPSCFAILSSLTISRSLPVQQLSFCGHVLEDQPGGMFSSSSDASAGDIDKLMVPVKVDGNIVGRTAHQVFASTQKVLQLGMCGGPAAVTLPTKSDDPSEFQMPYVAGLLEGIVPANHPDARLRNLAVFVESPEIASFLKEIEENRAEPLLLGEVGRTAVGADQDPDKMDLSKIF
eukprot:gene7690-8497_t